MPGKPGLTLFQTTVNRDSSAAQREHPCSLKEETEQETRHIIYQGRWGRGRKLQSEDNRSEGRIDRRERGASQGSKCMLAPGVSRAWVCVRCHSEEPPSSTKAVDDSRHPPQTASSSHSGQWRLPTCCVQRDWWANEARCRGVYLQINL